MENIKNLLGSAYKEGMTLEEVNTALNGKKLVDLSTGEYVAKAKYDSLETKHKNLQSELDQVKEQTKDYETIKSENANYKNEKATNELKAKLVGLGVDEKSFSYVKGDIDSKILDLGKDDETAKTAVETYLKDHPMFAKSGVGDNEPTPPKPIVVQTGVNKGDPNQTGAKVIATHSWNKNRGF